MTFKEQAERLRKPSRGTAKAQRRARKRVRDGAERKAKAKVRKRDKVCRFPLCGCRSLHLATEVSHQNHKGMGGNPAGDRSTTALMVLLCNQRHRLGRISIDQGTLRWEALTPAGADGPIIWYVKEFAIQRGGWRELPLAQEVAIREYEPIPDCQLDILRELALMKL